MNRTELKQAVTKIKMFLERSDLDEVNTGVEHARGLAEPAVFAALLEGCAIDEEGQLIRSKLFSGLDHALLSLIAYAPADSAVHESLQRSRISTLTLPADGWKVVPPPLAEFKHLTDLCLALDDRTRKPEQEEYPRVFEEFIELAVNAAGPA